MYDFCCNRCNSDRDPEMEEAIRYNSAGTEIRYLVAVCSECGEQVTDHQSEEFFDDLNRSSL